MFDRYKAALYRLYNRELRNVPTLRGQMVLKLTIEPSGAVSFLELVSSDMNAPALAAQVLERVRTFDFGAKERRRDHDRVSRSIFCQPREHTRNGVSHEYLDQAS